MRRLIGVDTNVLVRYLVRDDPLQGRLAERLIEAAGEDGEAVFLSTVVLAETVWVLSSVYAVAEMDILSALQRLLAAVEQDPANGAKFVVENEGAVRRAVEEYATGPAGFTDYLIGRLAEAAGATTTYTFDRVAAKAPTFKHLH